jgi:FMN phosphatase YigB (HAD superfamily)
VRILYFLEPTVELDRPLFRLPTIRNHLDHELRSLAARERELDVRLLCSERVAQAARAERLLVGVRTSTVGDPALRHVSPDAYAASLAWFDESHDAAMLGRAMEVYAAPLAGFSPDVVVCYESSAPFLAALFPRAVLVHESLGMFSRPPYPETTALDPFGLGRHSYLARFGAALRGRAISPEDSARLAALKARYRAAQSLRSPVAGARVRQGHRRVVLLPLQVSRYFMYDGHCPPELRGRPQAELVRYVLERVPSDVGVYVSLHGADASWAERGTLAVIARRHPNLLFDPELQRVPWPSQHLLPHVDAVVSVASSVGLQAMLWDLPVVQVGSSHLAGVAATSDLGELGRVLERGRSTANDPLLHQLLTHYYPSNRRYVRRAEWLSGYFARSVAWHRAGRAGDPFTPIAPSAEVYAGLADELRTARHTRELEQWAHKQPDTTRALGDATLGDATLVSFDVFDTLVARPFLTPRTSFHVIADAALRMLAEAGVAVSGLDFAALRERVIPAARARAASRLSEEYTLHDVYAELSVLVDVPDALRDGLIAGLVRLEEECEVSLCAPLASGVALLDEARRGGARVVLISDTYLSRTAVEALLARAGVRGFDALYVSSEHGVCKRSGALFERVRAEQPVGVRWLHVGDDPFTDVRVPARLGIRALRRMSPQQRYLEEARTKKAFPLLAHGVEPGASVVHGLIALRRASAGTPQGSAFGGSAYELGYAAGGPVLVGFCVWLWRAIRRDSIADVYFLARDGLLAMECLELLFPERISARLHYTYASRRAYALPALRTHHDLLVLAGRKCRPTPVAELLRQRFALAPHELALDVLQRHGFASPEEPVNVADPDQLAKLEALVLELAPGIFAQAREESALLEAYLAQQGLPDPSKRVAVVDIGHNASLQRALAVISGRDDLRGYYFATYREARAVRAEGLEFTSYLLDLEDAEASSHPYCRAVGMFEFLFLPPTRSIERLELRDGEIVPRHVGGDESRRMALAEEVQRGVRDFVRDFARATLGRPERVPLSADEAIAPYVSFVTAPDRADAALFEGVSFVDAFGGFEARYLVPPRPESRGPAAARSYLADAWWKEGARAALALPTLPIPELRLPVAGWDRKLRKLQRDPELFFLDAHAKPLRWVGRGLVALGRFRTRFQR